MVVRRSHYVTIAIVNVDTLRVECSFMGSFIRADITNTLASSVADVSLGPSSHYLYMFS